MTPWIRKCNFFNQHFEAKVSYLNLRKYCYFGRHYSQFLLDLHYCRRRNNELEGRINHLKAKHRLLCLKTQIVPRSKHFYLDYKNQSVYAVSGTSRCLFSDKYKTDKYSVVRKYNYGMLNLLVHHVTSGL